VLISSEDQLEEFRRVKRYPRLRKWFQPAAAGTMLNEIRGLAELAGPLPAVDVSADPSDNFLLAMAEAGKADYLVIGDGRHLLNLKRHRGTHIVTAREAAGVLGWP
jgi:putative PIN family toxin of toxin-antitoxin system